MSTSAAPTVGLVLSGPGSALGPVTDDLPLRQVVELAPWSSEAVRVWLRTNMRGEPSPELVDFICARSGGLPARAERTLKRLVAAGCLRQSPTGWTLDPPGTEVRSTDRALPAPLTELVGEARKSTASVHCCVPERMLTLVGPGGIGKTHLPWR